MSIELVSFVFGAVLLGVAVIGGGFEVKEIKLPRVGLVPRVVSFVLGAAFITFGALGYDALANRGAPHPSRAVWLPRTAAYCPTRPPSSL